MPTTNFKRPARFRVDGTDGFLVHLPNREIFMGFPNDPPDIKAMSIFEYGDPEVTKAAAEQGYAGRWIDEAEARIIEERQQWMIEPKPGGYPWDQWERDALAAGLDPELANLGRAVMREADQHGWCDSLKYECGIYDDSPEMAAGMILSAQEQPEWQKARWNWLLETDGLRFDPWEREEYDVCDLEWNSLHDRWAKENLPALDPKSKAAMRRDAYSFIREFHQLDQLAIIDLSDQAFFESPDKTTLYAEYRVIETEKNGDWLPHLSRKGIVQVVSENDQNGFDTAVFERLEEE